MARRKPKRRLVTQRSSDNDKRRLREPIPSQQWLDNLAQRVTFEGYSKHKCKPSAFGLQAYSGEPEDSTYCDGHADFAPNDMAKIPNLLQRGIRAGLIGRNEAQGDPTLIWTVDDTGWIFEGRITIPGRAIYHGYPVLPNEAIARKVIARYTDWVYTNSLSALFPSVQRVQEHYA